MAMTYDESFALMTDSAFRGRVQVACLRFADSIQNEEPIVPAHNARLRWANTCFLQPAGTAIQIQPPTVMDPTIQDAGATATDDQVQAAVETTVNKFF